MSAVLLLVHLVVAIAKGLPQTAPATHYTVTDLNTLPDADNTYANAINDQGQVAGWGDIDEMPRPFFWENNRMRSLGVPPGDDIYGNALTVNAAGQVLVIAESVDKISVAKGLRGPTGQTPMLVHPFLFQNGRWEVLASEGGSLNDARGLNDAGQVVGFEDSETVLWQGGHTRRLSALLPPDYVTGLNNRGQVIGSKAAHKGWHAFRLTGKHLDDLGTLPGYSSTEPTAINDKGWVVGYAWDVTPDTRSQERAFLWRGGRLIPLGALPLYTATLAEAVNNQGQVVGDATTAKLVQWPIHAFVWEDGVLRDLNDMIDPQSGWVLNSAKGINNHGQIVGNGVHNGQGHAFLLTPEAN